MRNWLNRFMMGRYGNDQLNRFLFGLTIVCVILQLVTRSSVLYYLTLVLLILGYLRMFSRNHQKRYAENMKFLSLRDSFMAMLPTGAGRSRTRTERKNFHIYRCPRCKQKIRIPRGKGKIRISCPKCGNQFIKKS